MTAGYLIRKLEPADKASFVSLMLSAFEKDPFYVELFGSVSEGGKARRRAEALLSFLFHKSFLPGEEAWGIYCAQNRLAGACVLERPSGRTVPHVKASSSLPHWAGALRHFPYLSLPFLIRYMQATRRGLPDKSHYLTIIGVDPGVQGLGIGTALIRYLLVLAQEDPQSKGLALDTENESNVAFYERVGFTLRRTVHVGTMNVYCMYYGVHS